MFDVISMVPGVKWPAIPHPRACQLLAMQFQLEQSQWLSPAELLAKQQVQLRSLLPFAYQCVPFYRERFDNAGLALDESFGVEDWRRIPLLTRLDIQLAGPKLRSHPYPSEHGPPAESLTSGSSGKPVLTVGTTVTRLMWSALTFRQHVWHKRDVTLKLAGIRSGIKRQADDPETRLDENWGIGTMDVVHTGPAVSLDIHTDIKDQADWLIREDPDYLNTYPSNAEALARYFLDHHLSLPRLREVRTFGEIVEPSVRWACRAAWNAPVVDIYSSQELGYIAMQCSQHEHYHVQSESVLVEVLRDDGSLCEPGEVGRIVITSLLNFAMPLIRYDIGDFAEVGEPCDCGRGLPVLRRIVGRQRNMLILPDGRRIWPAIDLVAQGEATEVPPIAQFQLVQRTRTELELLLVMPRQLTPEEELAVRRWVDQGVGYSFDVKITYVPSIPRSAGGKFEDVRCEVKDE